MGDEVGLFDQMVVGRGHVFQRCAYIRIRSGFCHLSYLRGAAGVIVSLFWRWHICEIAGSFRGANYRLGLTETASIASNFRSRSAKLWSRLTGNGG
jgi:hypothetical protein